MPTPVAAPQPVHLGQLADLIALIIDAKKVRPVLDELTAATAAYRAAIDEHLRTERSSGELLAQATEAKTIADAAVEQARVETHGLDAERKRLAEVRSQLDGGWQNLKNAEAKLEADRAAFERERAETLAALEAKVAEATALGTAAAELKATLDAKAKLLTEGL